MYFLKQLAMLLRMNMLDVPQRLGMVCTTVIGVACAVGVLISMLAMGVGARQAAIGNARPDRASVLSIDAVGPAQSNVSKELAALIGNLPGIRRNSRGEPVAVPEVSVYVQARRKDSGNLVWFPLKGAGAGFTDYATELSLTAGRMFRPGVRELIASNYCAHEFQQFGVNDRPVIQGAEWLVVGNFDLGQTTGTCVVYSEADTVLSAVGRSSYNQVNVMLQSPATFADLVNAISGNPLLHVKVEHEADLAAASFERINGILDFVSYFVGAILAVAATIGAANSLYALVDSRRRELATLRAVGFSGAPIVVATLSEAILLAIPGALIGAGLAWLFFDGLAASPLGYSFHLAVTPQLATVGIGWALGMGVISGLLPAVRAARVPVAVALRTM
ncbi:MAG TPA: ABC transporter permease [Steroidobacteraceae bacterium]|nr:ABC transporter permease [Steroidobacteraceae bacterium]